MNTVKMGFTIEEAAECTGIGRNTMRKLVDWGKLPVLKVGTVDYEALQKALADRTKLASQLVMKQADFTAEAADGVKSVTLDFDASKWLKADAPADCTVFEFLLHDGKLVAAHADIDDKGRVNLSYKDALKEIKAKKEAGEPIK